MRRDLDLGVDPAELVLQPPDRSELKEIFRRFEFRALLGRVDTLDEAMPAAERPETESETVSWREGDLRGGFAAASASPPTRSDSPWRPGTGEVILTPAPLPRASGLDVVAHDAKALRLGEPAADDTMILAYLIDPGRAEYELDDLMAEYGVELEPDPPAEEETAALVRHAEAAWRLAGPLAAKVGERGSDSLYRDVELPLSVVLAAMEDAGVRIDTYRMGEITARLSAIASRSSSLARTTSRARSSSSARRSSSAGSSSRSSSSRQGARERRATRPTRRCCSGSAPTTRSSQ